ncbi:endosome-associated-trafficking regulator 1 isoform X2 [Nothobranchius furzeri]|uniref:Endosome-associated-trafficking regulator 1 n=1 Tax=Nothobranchius furzeri TaxID=105023 RepID=A0A9D2XNL6_NOTFU|nr:transcript variant X2 [Nothobranchius furzeri]
MSRRRGGKTLIIADDEEEQQQQPEELNPFSFREFLRCKDQDRDQNQDRDRDRDQTRGKEKEGGRSLQTGADIISFLYTEEKEETRFCSRQERDAASGGEGETNEGDEGTSMSGTAPTCRGQSGSSSHIQQLKGENISLRRTIRELQRSAEVDRHRLAELSEELLQRRRREEKEAQDLESMVQSVEQNLQLMTRRAVKAENSVSRLKAELQQLQVEAESLRSENNGLKAAESRIITNMRQNAQAASEYLDKTANHAHSSIHSSVRRRRSVWFLSSCSPLIGSPPSTQTPDLFQNT